MASDKKWTDPSPSPHRRIQAAGLVAVRRQPRPCMAHPRALSHAHAPDLPVVSRRSTRDLRNRGSHQHLILHGMGFLQRPVEPRPAHLGQLTYLLDPQPALPRHHASDLIIDVRAPALPVRWRRASTLCKAPLKQSTSRTFAAKTRLSRLTSFRSVASRDVPAEPSPLDSGSSYSRHRDNSRRLMPSSFASATMRLHGFSRPTAMCRKAFGTLPTRFLPTCHLLVSRVPIRCVSI